MVSEDEMATPTRPPRQNISVRQMQQHLVDFASLYHGSVTKEALQHPSEERVEPWAGFTVEDVCHPGNTLLWDLVQEDTAHLLPEGLAAEAEKALHTLVCYTTNPKIKMQFIEACVENLTNHKSVVVSLRLLPKLFSTFQPYRGGLDTYSVTMWAEKELGMMSHFFKNLVHSTELAAAEESRPFSALYTRKEEIQVQLHFLSCIFSSAGSPDNFRLSLEQVDTLWNCLATSSTSSDECLHWFLQQAKSKEHHAMGLDTFKHIFCEKMPLLQPETISMTGLNLFTQLCQLANVANVALQTPVPEEQINDMNQLWGIALRAQNTDVSLTAIQYLNNYYINYGSGVLEKEDEFITRCMSSLVTALSQMDQNPESNLLVIQRGLILLTNHLDSFRKRYAFHLRNWQLDKHGISSHQKGLQDKQCVPIRVVLQPAGSSEKTTIEMLSTDLISELRAEVTRWWEALHRQHQLRQQQQEQQQQSTSAQHQGSVLTPILGAMLGDGPIRMITLGQELTADLDEKTLCEMQFKDLQLVFVSVGNSRPPRKHDGSTPASYLTPPPREKLPMMLLLAEPHFEQIFGLLQDLSNLKCSLSDIDTQEELSLQTKARVLSRKVWELLMLLPTNPAMLSGFRSITQTDESCGDGHKVRWDSLLDQHSPHKLMYSLQIVESLSKAPKHRRRILSQSGDSSCLQSPDSDLSVDSQDQPEEIWSRKFVSNGGLSHLFGIFLSGSLQAKEGDHWNEWHQECLGYLLRLLSQFAVCQADQETNPEEAFDSYESPKKRMKKSKSIDKITIPRLNQTMLKMIEIDRVLKILMSILYDAAMPRESNQWHLERWGRAEVVHYAMSFLVSWAHSSADVQPALCSSPHFSGWLKRLILEAPEPHVRQESCRGIYRLCLGRTNQGQTGYAMLLPLLSSLLVFLDNALKMKTLHKETPEEKEPYGPGCRDYFWLLCRLVESLTKEDAQSSWLQEDSIVNLDTLARQLAKSIKSRGYIEKRPNVQEDNGLIGLLNLFTVVIKHKPPFHSSVEGQDFLVEMFSSLFALPSPVQRYLPKCKSQVSRSAAYDLLVEMVKDSLENYSILHERILAQHTKDSHSAYPWDHWPHEDGRSKCGYVGLTNLGATCYMATCMQHLYMIPQARKSVLEAQVSQTLPTSTGDNKHEGTLMELKKMFAYLLESERKAYNPRSFCKVYTMDKQPLNTGEQKDMTEFFTDLISKLEEMSPELKKCVKNLFGGVITNNVVSLDCPHVSRTKDEFYTVRCQVADMKNLYESLDEVTVKDMLEGDNMYTCSKCQKKVRAEKRACFKTLPNILCFNTMRYTFNMVTMMKEKVNTHFSFPLRLDMTGYMEKHLIHRDRLADVDGEKEDEEEEREEKEGYEYELIGVTVHTGTADGGHYYSFIRDRVNKNENGQDKWYLFNDAEVKPFDPTQIATECFGGEMTSKTYDQVTDKFMDFSFEKTNSAYMLFYERYKSDPEEEKPLCASMTETVDESEPVKFRINLSQDLAEWIWQDNMNFLQDKNIFEHTYFGFMWQMCGYIPTTLPRDDPEKKVSLMATKLSASFVLETLIHSKEKPTMLQWIELLTKLFNSCQAACEWFLEHMAKNDWWPLQILIKCPNQVVRQMFQRLVIHVISQLKPVHENLYLHPLTHSDNEEVDMSQLGSKSCVTRFIKRMLAIIEHGVKPHSKHLTEYFAFLLEFAKMGEEECMFLIHLSAITTMVNFYMGHKSQENYVEILSDDEEEEEEEVISLTEDKYRPQSLDKMISLISMLVEKSRGEDRQLNLTDRDYSSIVGGKSFPFLFSQIRDNINIRQTCNLIFSLCRWNDGLALAVVQMIFGAIVKLSPEQCQPFFKLLSMLAEIIGGPPGMPPFTQYVLQKVWEVADYCPQQCLEWLSTQVMRNKLAHTFTLRNMNLWVEPYLLAHNNMRVRTAAAALLVSLVPSNHFRQAFRSTRSLLSPHKDLSMTQDTVMVLHDVYEHLLRLMSKARHYVDAQTHGTMKLMSYFALMTYCLVSKTEKLMFSPFFMDLWTLFQPKLSEPPIPMNHNKQALLIFWYQVCSECPENVKLIVTNAHITKNIAFNYILADHDDQDVVLFNRCMLPAYYGILRMCCHQSRSFTRHLAQHQNIQWAFKNITPYPTQYTAAVDELFKMMRLMVTQFQDSSDDELKAIAHFRRTTIQLYLTNLEARSGWQTLISAFKILIDSTEDQLLIIYHGGLCMMTEAFFTLHMMYHEATACHVTGDIVDLLALMQPIIRQARTHSEKKAEMKSCLYSWKDRMEFVRKLLTLLNSYTPPDIRQITLDVLREMVLTFQNESLQTIVPILTHSHSSFQDHNMPIAVGPYFPKRYQKTIGSKANIRPPRPQFQMFLHSNQLEITKGVDENYDAALQEFFSGYHAFIDLLCRVAANQQNLNESVINLSAMVAYEGVPLHSPYFAKLWTEIYHLEQIDKNYIGTLCHSSFFIDYVDAVLLDERQSLNNQHIYQFFTNYFPKVHTQVMNDQGHSLLDSLVASITAEKSELERVQNEKDLKTIMQRINGDLRAMMIIFSVQPPKELTSLLSESLHYILDMCRTYQAEQEAKLKSSQKQRSAVKRKSNESVQEANAEDQTPETEKTEAEEGTEDNQEQGDKEEETETEKIQEQDRKNESGETPSKRRRTTSNSDTHSENEQTSKAGPKQETETEKDISMPSTSAQMSPKTSPSGERSSPDTSDELGQESPRPVQREKPGYVEMVARNVEHIFSMCSNSSATK